MRGRKRTILVDPTCLRRGLKEAICSFCRDVLVSRGLLRPDALDEPGMSAEQERVIFAVSRRWQSKEVAFEPDDPPPHSRSSSPARWPLPPSMRSTGSVEKD